MSTPARSKCTAVVWRIVCGPIRLLLIPELQQVQTLLGHEMEKRREQKRDRLFEEFAALARARGIAIHEVARRTRSHASPAKRGPAKRVRRPVPVKFRHPDQKELT
jgi:hypothetical protein